MRLLDELAQAMHVARGDRTPKPLIRDLELERQFELPITPSRWQVLAEELNCQLPPLEAKGDGLWAFPFGWTTIRHLLYYLADHYGEGESITDWGGDEWYEAQIFTIVREQLVETCNIDREDVVRQSRLIGDLGM